MTQNTSYGQTLMRELLNRILHAQFKENFRPDWLFGMELDFYSEELNLAVEFQGGQHFTPVYGMTNLRDQRRRDSQKKKICKERGIALLRLEAADLLYGKMRFKMKRLGLGGHLKKATKGVRSFKKGVEYRETLKQSFNCPTAYEKGSSGRKVAFSEAFGSNQIQRNRERAQGEGAALPRPVPDCCLGHYKRR